MKIKSHTQKILLTLSVFLLASFVVFSYLVHTGIFNVFDFDITVKMQDHFSRNWDLPFSIFSLLGSAEVTGLVWLGLLLYAFLRKYWLTFAGLFLFFVSNMVEILGKLMIVHPGPPFMFYRGVFDFSFPSHYISTSYSYPSGHVTRTAFLIIFLMGLTYFKSHGRYRKALLVLLPIFLFLMVVSRIYLGEHWTTDVIGGLLMGTSLGIAAILTLPSFKKA
jgi:undecaprenyl-diphosphatase